MYVVTLSLIQLLNIQKDEHDLGRIQNSSSVILRFLERASQLTCRDAYSRDEVRVAFSLLCTRLPVYSIRA